MINEHATRASSSAMPAVPRGRSAQIDFLRGVAIFAVLLLHFSLTYQLADSPLAGLVPVRWLHAAIDNGNYGVTMFFVISGYLITSNNLARFGHLHKVSLRQFYALRIARIVPPLLLALAVIVPLGLAGTPSFMNEQNGVPLPASFSWLAVLSVLTFWHNVLMQMHGYFNYCLNIYWSLSVEEVFYLLFPLACIALKRERWIMVLCLAAVLFAPWYRGLHREDELYFMYGYPACFDAIALGCLAAMLLPKMNPGARTGMLIRAGAALLLAATFLAGIEGHEQLGFTFIAMCTAALLLDAADDTQRGAGNRFGRTVGWAGRHSYELYLFHILILGALRDLLPRHAVAGVYKWPLFVLFLALCAALAHVIERFFADPVNRWLRSRTVHSRRGAA